MALAFMRAPLRITNESGAHEDTTSQTFPSNIRVDKNNRPVVDVAIQSFKLDLASGGRPTDIVQVTASVANAGGASVTVRIKTDYSGGRYSGEVTALIIADLVEAGTAGSSTTGPVIG